MKKIVLIAVCMTASGFLFSQSSNTHFGLKAGVNVAGLHADNGDDINSLVSFNAGGLAHIHITHHFAVQPEIYFSGQGGKNASTTLQLDYLNIPVLLQYMAGTGFRLETGPQLGFLLSANDKVSDAKLNVKGNMNATDFSWAFGLGYQFPGTGAGIDARYNLGISDVDNAGNIQNRVFAIGLFYQFMNGKGK